MKDNIIDKKSKVFALRIIAMYKYLTEHHKEFVISKQVLRAGTSIGANVREGEVSQSEADFLSKMYIAYKEANETHYWLELLYASEYIYKDSYVSICNDCEELLKLLSSITKTQKEKILSQKRSIPNS